MIKGEGRKGGRVLYKSSEMSNSCLKNDQVLKASAVHLYLNISLEWSWVTCTIPCKQELGLGLASGDLIQNIKHRKWIMNITEIDQLQDL